MKISRHCISFTRTLLAAASLVSWHISCPAALAKQPAEPDFIIYNAKIIADTAEIIAPATAIAVQGEKVLAIGNDARIKALKGPHTDLIDANGRLILPGFHDSHVHLAEGAVELTQLRLNDCKGKSEILASTKEYLANHTKLKELIGNGLSLPALKDSQLSRLDLDAINSSIPIFIYAEDGHCAWLNSKALEKIKPSDLEKFSKTKEAEKLVDGTFSGVLREEGLSLLENAIVGPTRKERAKALKDTLKLAHSFGITSIQDAHATKPVLDAYMDLARQNALTMRVVACLHTSPGFGQSQLQKLLRERNYYQHKMLRANNAKIFADGVIETGTAAMLKPYLNSDLNRPTNRGRANYSEIEMNNLVDTLARNRFNIHIHAIGDRAVRQALDALSAVRNFSQRDDLRHQIAHLECVDPQDRRRFADLDVTANFESYWAFRDPYVEQLTLPVLGAVRAKDIYPLGSIAKPGARLAAGSDWTVSTLNPLCAMQVAVTRQPLDDRNKEPLNENERVDLASILTAYTIGGAHVNHSEKETGSLTPGKYADFVIFDRDFTTASPYDIAKTKVMATYVGGERVFCDPAFVLSINPLRTSETVKSNSKTK